MPGYPIPPSQLDAAFVSAFVTNFLELSGDHTMTDKTAKTKIKDTGKETKPPVTGGVLEYFPRALMEIAKVSAFGAKKHGVSLADRAFMVLPMGVFEGAQGRHILGEFIDGPYNSADGGLLHKAQNAWNALAALEIYLTDNKED